MGRTPRISKCGFLSFKNSGKAHTGAAEDTGHLDELNGLLAGIHLVGRERALSSRVGVGWTRVREC
jgi:hypothetical protein